MKKIDCIVGYPKSGNNWLSYILERVSGCGIKCGQYSHGESEAFSDDIKKQEKNFIFIMRYYKCCIPRYLNAYDAETIIGALQGTHDCKHPDYMYLLKAYDSYPTDKKIIVRYEDLMLDPMKTMKNVLDSIGESDEKLIEFMSTYDYHKTKSLEMYLSIDSSQTRGDYMEFHRNRISDTDRTAIKKHLIDKFPELYSKYLS